MARAIFAKLIRDLRGTGQVHHVALADNLQRDLPYEDDPAPPKRAAGCGMNIPPAMAEKVAEHLRSSTTLDYTASEFPKHFQNLIFSVHPDPLGHAFELTENDPNRVSSPVRCVRYVSLRAFLPQALGLDKSDRKFNQAKIRKTTEDLMAKHRAPGSPPSSMSVWLHMKDDRTKIVFVGPDDEAPDVQGAADGLTGDQLARYVIQRLALPGFENAQRRAERGGFIALCFVPNALTPPLSLYKPTTFDAADNLFFRPGPTDAQHGLTDTLTDTLDAVTGQSGCKEWVTRNGVVPLAPSTKHGQTWRFVAYFDQSDDSAVKPTP